MSQIGVIDPAGSRVAQSPGDLTYRGRMSQRRKNGSIMLLYNASGRCLQACAAGRAFNHGCSLLLQAGDDLGLPGADRWLAGGDRLYHPSSRGPQTTGCRHCGNLFAVCGAPIVPFRAAVHATYSTNWLVYWFVRQQVGVTSRRALLGLGRVYLFLCTPVENDLLGFAARR